MIISSMVLSNCDLFSKVDFGYDGPQASLYKLLFEIGIIHGVNVEKYGTDKYVYSLFKQLRFKDVIQTNVS